MFLTLARRGSVKLLTTSVREKVTRALRRRRQGENQRFTGLWNLNIGIWDVEHELCSPKYTAKSLTSQGNATSTGKAQAFQELAHVSLTQIYDTFEDWADEIDFDDYDGSIEAGVITLSFKNKQTFILNKQTAACQLWLSSPLSGPTHYNFCEDRRGWYDTRTGASLTQVLKDEIEYVTDCKGLHFSRI